MSLSSSAAEESGVRTLKQEGRGEEMENEGEGEKKVVTFLGPVASYTHQATLSTFPESTHTLTPVITIEDVFASVQSGTATRGVVPFENSSNGSVVFTLDLFADVQKKYPDIVVCGEAYVAVSHCLLGRPQSNDGQGSTSSSTSSAEQGQGQEQQQQDATSTSQGGTKPTAKPLTSLSHITKLYSHPQAWGQCNVFLNTYLKGIERRDVSSTSRAAQLAAEDASGTSAAVSSAVAAQMYGVDVLARGIEDRGDNVTRFFVVKKRKEGSEAAQKHIADPQQRDADADAQWKTLVSFTVDHANPGSLAHSLAVFSRYGLNLTSINTRPSGVENWNYIFFVEFKGRRRLEGRGRGEEEGAVNRALRDLDGVCKAWRWLGSWENRLVS